MYNINVRNAMSTQSNQFGNRLRLREWDEYDIVADTEVDKLSLDICAERQSHNMLKWQELLAQANERLTKAKEALVYQESILLLKARSDGIPGVDKITDAVVKAWVTTQDVYRMALKKKIKAESDVALISAGIKALENAKEMIKVEANLWICGYYSKPNVKEIVSAEQQELRRKDTSTELKNSFNRRRLAKETE